ncbi:MAG: hypothetical protein B6D45_07300 [Ignavibacteriales bacterium UTCHB3]|nr:MAG: hypothetical protein B6D45_07300 [Ignavibacteriales bacterium UTCHB3]
MELDLRTLTVVLGLFYLSQLGFFYYYYSQYRKMPGLKYWVLWSAMGFIGFAAMMFRDSPELFYSALVVQNLTLIAGTISFYVGLSEFFKGKAPYNFALATFFVFSLAYLYFTFIQDELVVRRIVSTVCGLFVYTFVIYELLACKEKLYRKIARFLSVTFIFYNLLLLMRLWWLIFEPPVKNLFEYNRLNAVGILGMLLIIFIWSISLFMMINRRLEQEKQSVQQFFRTIFHNSPDSMVITELDGPIIECNEAAYRTFGYDCEEVKGKRITEIGIWVNPEAREGIVKRLLAEGSVSDLEIQFVKKNGEKIYCLFSSTVLQTDGKMIMLTTVKDINHLKMIEENIRVSEEKYRSLADTTPDLVMLHDVNLKILYFNKTGYTVTGYTPEEIIGKDVRAFITEEDSSDVDKRKEKRFAGKKEVFQYQVKFRKKDGSFILLEVRTVPIYRDGKLDSILGVARDISLQLAYTEELKLAKEKAEEINKLKSHFFETMSHEPRTPFVGIWGYAELLSEMVTDPEASEMVSLILNNSMRLTDTLNKILSLSHLEFGEVKVSPEEFRLKSLLKMVTGKHRITADKKGINLVVNSLNEDKLIRTDKTILFEILDNLVGNAVKYSNEGTVELSCTHSVQKGKKDILSFTVSDEGIGIPKEKQDIIWLPFRQASEGISRIYEGSGLGLSVTKHYVELLNGEISLKSEVGKGSVFSFYIELLPQEKKKAKLPSAQLIDSNQKHTNKRLLFIDDDPQSHDIISRVLSDSYYIDLGKDANEALKLTEKNSYDAFLFDINLLHGLDGVELMKIVKAKPGNEQKPFVAVTAFAGSSDREEFLEAGFTHYLSKPFFLQDLIDLVDGLFK